MGRLTGTHDGDRRHLAGKTAFTSRIGKNVERGFDVISNRKPASDAGGLSGACDFAITCNRETANTASEKMIYFMRCTENKICLVGPRINLSSVIFIHKY